MLNCLALYRGERLSDLNLVAISSDQTIIADFAERILADSSEQPGDPVVAARQNGIRNALRIVAGEASDE